MEFREIIELAKKRGLIAGETNHNDNNTTVHDKWISSRQDKTSADRRRYGDRGSDRRRRER